MTHELNTTPATFPVETDAHAPGVVPFKFTGTAGEYFRIWIVNLLLSVLTLGIYSAWAKVRNKQYFYRHTYLGDSSFEYLGNPMAILRGRIVIAAVLVGISLAQQYSPILYLMLMFGVFLATPWVIVQALSFNARNSAYRNVRLSFTGTTSDSYTAYLVGGALYMVTCGLGMPYLQWRISQFAVDGHHYGDAPFRFRTQVADYFIAFLLAFALTIPIMFLYMGGMFAFIGVAAMGSDKPDPAMMAAMPVLIVAFYALLIVPGAYLKMRIANLFWGGIEIGQHKLESTQGFKEVLLLQVTNILAIIFTLGLAIPWAKVRSHRYRMEHLTLLTQGPLVVNARESEKVGAFGDAATDLGDMDFDFGG